MARASPAHDDSQLASLNAAWDIAATAPAAQPGWRGRLAGFIWRTVAPYLQQQVAFNSRLVDHLNRQAAAARHAHQRAELTAARLREEFARLAEFQARLLQYLQQVTAYIDTRDRRSAGGALVLNASLSGLAENVDKRWESLSVRDQRADARATALAASQDELRALLAVVQQASLSLKREVEHVLAGHGVQEVQGVQDGSGFYAGVVSVPRQLQVRRVRGSVSRIARRHTGAARKLPPVFCRRHRRSRCRLRARRVSRTPRRRRRPRTGHRSESRDGRALSRARPRRHRGRCRRLPHDPPRRIARRPLRGAGGRAPAARISASIPRARLPQGPPRWPRGPRDAESGVLGGVLRQLHPRHHARVAAPPRDAEISGPRERIHARRPRVPIPSRARGSPAGHRASRRRRRVGSPTSPKRSTPTSRSSTPACSRTSTTP